jgi:hypothetical protein
MRQVSSEARQLLVTRYDQQHASRAIKDSNLMCDPRQVRRRRSAGTAVTEYDSPGRNSVTGGMVVVAVHVMRLRPEHPSAGDL